MIAGTAGLGHMLITAGAISYFLRSAGLSYDPRCPRTPPFRP